MTNREYITSLTDEQLAKYLIKTRFVLELDEDLGCMNEVLVYETPNGEDYYDYDFAIEATVNWLNYEQIEM